MMTEEKRYELERIGYTFVQEGDEWKFVTPRGKYSELMKFDDVVDEAYVNAMRHGLFEE